MAETDDLPELKVPAQMQRNSSPSLAAPPPPQVAVGNHPPDRKSNSSMTRISETSNFTTNTAPMSRISETSTLTYGPDDLLQPSARLSAGSAKSTPSQTSKQGKHRPSWWLTKPHTGSALSFKSEFSAISAISAGTTCTTMPVTNMPSVGFFMDNARIKQRVRKAMEKPAYDVTERYWDTGICQMIARSAAFDRVVLLMIAFNAIWVAIDTDFNETPVLTDSDFVFQFAEHSFCAFFLAEWLIRFASFKNKCDCLVDAWFIFDSILVFMLILETWILTIVVFIADEKQDGTDAGTGLRETSILRIARVLRVARMARMARLLRAMPEVLILVKGLVAAMRSVFFALCLVLAIVFVFAIAFTQLTRDLPVHDLHFKHVPLSMYTLMFRGALLDNSAYLVNEIADASLPMAGLFVVFVFISALTLMNMLIGVLVEVVSSVASLEHEHAAMTFVKSKMEPLVQACDEDGNRKISREEFTKMMEHPSAIRTLQDVGVDPVGLVDYADFIFTDVITGQDHGELTFSDVISLVLELRGSSSATVKDIVDLRKFITQVFCHFEDKLDNQFSKRLHQHLSTRSGGASFHSTTSTQNLPTASQSVPPFRSRVSFDPSALPEGLSDDCPDSTVPGNSQASSPDAGAISNIIGRAQTEQHSNDESICRGRSNNSDSRLADTLRETLLQEVSLMSPTGSWAPVDIDGPISNNMQFDISQAGPAGIGQPKAFVSENLQHQFQKLNAIIKSSTNPCKAPASPETLASGITRGASRGLQTKRIGLRSNLREGESADCMESCAQAKSPVQQPPDNLLRPLDTMPINATEVHVDNPGSPRRVQQRI